MFTLSIWLAWAVSARWVIAEPARGTRGMVATVDALATEAGLGAMKSGGNAVDAAVACGLTLGVVNGYNSGIGGGCLILLRLADGSYVAIDGREEAPAAATRDMYVRRGKVNPQLSQTGALASAVPGALAAYALAVERYGKLPFRTHLLTAAQLAERGFRIDGAYARQIRETAADLERLGTARGILLRADGSPRREGEMLRQPDLARTYRAIAENGLGWFYQGPFAQATEAWMREHNGTLRAEDFRHYQVKFRQPLIGSYRGLTLVGFPPPSSGGLHVQQALNILEHFDLRAMGPSSADYVHVVAEALKLAFADRAYWLGDPDFVPIPPSLATKEYAATLAQRIRLARVTPVLNHGEPDAVAPAQHHTTHFSTADAVGNCVACTATINTTFGAKIIVPGTGVVLNNEMDDFSAQPGAANYFGLVGAKANAIAPGKRPLSSMSPTLVLREGKPILAVGAAGGPTIISQTLLVVIDTVDFNLNVEQTLAQPRFHHQWKPDELVVERGMNPMIIRELTRRGHKVKVVKTIGVAQAVGAAARGFEGAADPRAGGQAGGW